MNLLHRLSLSRSRPGSAVATTDRPAAHRVRRYRRLGAIVSGALAVGVVVQTLAPPEPETVAVVTAASALEPGSRLSRDDLRTVRLPRDLPWASPGVEGLVGRTVAVPVAAGEPLTSGAVTGGEDLPPGRESLFLPVIDPPVLEAAGPGTRVRLVERATGRTLASTATVRSSVPADPDTADSVGGLWLVLTPGQADAVASAGAEATGAELPVAVVLSH